MPIIANFPTGDSAYQRAVDAGFIGTEEEFYQQLAQADNFVTAQGGGNITVSETIGAGPFTFEFTEESEEDMLTPESIGAANKDLSNVPDESVKANMISDDALAQLGALLAIAAAAAYGPEGSYAVGDYCTHGGKLHKCNTPIPSGEAWNPAHWTETSVAAELAGKADVAAPPEHSIVPKNGATLRSGYKNSFSKDQFGHVIGNFAFSFSSPLNNGTVLFSLPQGYIPTARVDAVAWCYDNTGENYCVVIGIGSDGDATISLNVPAGRIIISLNGTFVF